MGFSGCHINRHSGTANKPRKNIFKSSKKGIEIIQVEEGNYNIDKFGEIKPTPPFRNNKHDSLIKYGVKVPIAILFLMAYGKAIHFYANYKYDNWPIVRERIISEEQRRFDKELIDAYHISVKQGFRYLDFAEYQLAQAEFSHAIRLFPKARKARVGLYTALSQQCILENKYCAEAAENLKYLKHMNYSGVAE